MYLRAMTVVRHLKRQTLPLNSRTPSALGRPKSSIVTDPLLKKQLEEKERDEAHATALMIAKRWKLMAARKRALDEENQQAYKAATGVGPTVHTPLLSEKKETKQKKVEEKVDVDEDDDDDSSSEEKSDEPFRVTLAKSLAYMVIGLAMVAVFSDPMVDVLSKLGAFLKIPPFYISFIITPLCSNASELIASIVFASKKTVVSSSMTYSQLYGAATMNSTLGLGIFYTLIYARGLAWEFSAETMAILFVTWAVCITGGLKTVYQTYWAIPNSALYPLSLLVVWMLENLANWK